MKRLALIAALALIAGAALADDNPEDSLGDWQPIDPADLTPEGLNLLLGAVTVDGPLVAEFEFTPYRSEGVLEGCGYSYSVLMKDWAYRSSQPIFISGSIVYFAYKDRSPFLSFKIVIQDIEERDNRLWKKTTPVNYAYLRLGDESTAGKEDVVLDLEGGFKSFSYLDSDPDPEKTLMSWLVIPELSIWFNREPKSTDLSFKLSLYDQQEALYGLAACYREMAGFQE